MLIDGRFQKEWEFSNFREALVFTNKIGEIAEKLNHHPEICLTWGKVRVSTWTHSEKKVTKKDLELINAIES